MFHRPILNINVDAQIQTLQFESLENMAVSHQHQANVGPTEIIIIITISYQGLFQQNVARRYNIEPHHKSELMETIESESEPRPLHK